MRALQALTCVVLFFFALEGEIRAAPVKEPAPSSVKGKALSWARERKLNKNFAPKKMHSDLRGKKGYERMTYFLYNRNNKHYKTVTFTPNSMQYSVSNP